MFILVPCAGHLAFTKAENSKLSSQFGVWCTNRIVKILSLGVFLLLKQAFTKYTYRFEVNKKIN